MRLLVYKNGSVIVDEQNPAHSARINGQEPDSVLPVTEQNIRTHMKLDLKKLTDERRNFHLLQQKHKRG